MARQTDQNRVHEIADYVKRHPGAHPADIAKDLQVPRSTISRNLPALETTGHLLWEDDRGGLWPFRRR